MFDRLQNWIHATLFSFWENSFGECKRNNIDATETIENVNSLTSRIEDLDEDPPYMESLDKGMI
jgi:hypothetical protein